MSSLFGDAQQANLRSCELMVEAVLADRKLDPQKSRVQSPAGPGWALRHGSAEVFVLLTSSATGVNFIQVVAPVMVPTGDDAIQNRLWRRLLELNARELVGAAFGLRDQAVVVTADRSTLDLDRSEVEEMVRRVAEYADHYDDALVAEFGGRRHADL